MMSRSTVFDITERKKVENALRQSEETYRALFENANEGIFIFSLDNIIQRANPHGSEMLGYSTEELVGKLGNDFIAQENVENAEQRWQRLLAGKAPSAYERKLLKKDGTWVDAEISLSLIRDGTGTPRYIQSVVRDISTRKRAEETLRLANAELERALRMKDEFLANMSHELRTPLNAILGLSESMLEETAGPVNEKQKRYLIIVNESGRHLLELINDILDLAKIESGQVKLDMKNVSIKDICEASLRMIKQLAHKKNQLVSLEIASEAGMIRADERRLKQMIVNLLSNAVKFTPENKKLGLEVQVDKSHSSLLITVWDEGIGMDEQDLKRLFQPFVQLDSGLSRESGGTGLGLALVAEMARLHGGGVTIESKPGYGSRFTISLPWEESLPIEFTRKTKDTGRLSFPRAQVTENPETILLVEDTDHVVIMIKDYLEQNGYQVVIAQNGLEGVVQAKTLRPDLILMDVQMPGMDGLEATRRIRQEVGLGDIPIIALTALAMSSDRERCLAAGMNDYISKPVKLKNLLKTIQQYLPGTQDAKEN
jgi:PAS domain S-box-containing protein